MDSQLFVFSRDYPWKCIHMHRNVADTCKPTASPVFLIKSRHEVTFISLINHGHHFSVAIYLFLNFVVSVDSH